MKKKPRVIHASEDATETFRFVCECGRQIKPWQKFCPECGYLLDWESVFEGLSKLLRRLEVE